MIKILIYNIAKTFMLFWLLIPTHKVMRGTIQVFYIVVMTFLMQKLAFLLAVNQPPVLDGVILVLKVFFIQKQTNLIRKLV